MCNRSLTPLIPRATDPFGFGRLLRAGIIAVAMAMLGGNAAVARQQPPARDELVSTARQAFTLVESWAQRGSAPGETVALRSADVAAVCVTLRLQGLRLGRAIATVDEPARRAADDEPIDISPLLRRATAEALAGAREALPKLDAEIAGQAMPDDLDQVANLISVDLQIARPPRPLRLEALRDLPDQIVVGLHGLATRQDGAWGWLFPATALEANLSLPGQVQRLLGEVKLPPEAIARIGAEGGPTLYRFDVVHLVRLAPDQRPAQLRRGQLPMSTRPPNLAQLQTIADLWAQRMIQWQRDDGALPGGYAPTADRFEPQTADPVDAALACMALGRYSRLNRLDEQTAEQAAEAARRGIRHTLQRIGVRAEGERAAAPTDLASLPTATAAMLAVAIIDTPGTGALKEARDELGEILLAARQPDGGFRRATQGRAKPVSPTEQALISYAAVKLYDQTREAAYLKAGRAAIVQLWRDHNARQAIDLLPWIALAEMELSRLEKATPGLITLREACEQARQRQVDSPAGAREDTPEAMVARDAVGGFRLPAGLIDEPTWHSARPLIAIAAALTNQNFVGRREQSRWLLDAASGLRFLAQLTLKRDAAWYVRRPSRAIGGVRTAFWDNRQPLPATALALLAAVELETSINRLADQQAPPTPQE